MSRLLNVETPSETYGVHIEEDWAGLKGAFAAAGVDLGKTRVFVVSDSNVAPLYLGEVLRGLDGVKAETFTFDAGEGSKNLETVARVYSWLGDRGADRTSVIVALGGGVVGDLAGFAAATFMRGIRFVQLPTSLLAMVDSSVGGKTGVDFGERKNLVGAFLQPVMVYANVSALRTLPGEQFASGMGEVIKHGLIADGHYFECLSCYEDEIAGGSAYALIEMVAGSVGIKAGVVGRDERESGLREILNFGHTFGHAVESLCNFELPHGVCVGLGMVAACGISDGLGDGDRAEIRRVLGAKGLLVRVPERFGLTAEAVYGAMLGDKKAVGGSVNLVLLEGIGKAVRVRDADRDLIIRGIEAIL